MGGLSLLTQAEGLERPGDEETRRQKEGLSTRPSCLPVSPPCLGLLVASFGDPAAADYAAYACRLGDGKVTVVADAGILRQVEAPARPYPLQDLAQAAPPTAAGRGPFTALILFLNPRLSERDRRA